jgi:malate dehydrogenase (oxaloacetate-decarboxylating)
MDFEFERNSETGSIKCIQTRLSGMALLQSAFLNKSTAFSRAERIALELNGLLPYKEETIEMQIDRSYSQIKKKNSNIEKYIYLNKLHDNNTTLFYALASKYLEEIMPLIYTPTVGDAVERFSHIIRQPQGFFLSYKERDHMDNVFKKISKKEIDFIIVTDGEAVLGIGDQGIGGIDISIGKLMVYIICSGINPARVLPIQLDVGTNNKILLNDPMYLGWKHERLKGEEYDSFIEQFVQNVKTHFPQVYLHWEDFGRDNARRILNKYRKDMCTFNDDIQGTGIVAAANLIASVKSSKSDIKEQRVIMFGAGTAGCGIADQICSVIQDSGLSLEEARSRIYLIDRDGLVTNKFSGVPFFQEPYIKDIKQTESWKVKNPSNITLLETIKGIKPTMLIGCSAVFGAFNEEIVKEMAKYVEYPVIMPLSNPNSKSEAEPKDIIEWTKGKAIVAAGSPYDPVKYNGKTYRISQANNAFIFPGLGMGAIAVKSKLMTSNMINAACYALSELSPRLKDSTAPLLPPISDIRKVSEFVSRRVAKQAIEDGVATELYSDIDKLIRYVQWDANYYPYKLLK